MFPSLPINHWGEYLDFDRITTKIAISERVWFYLPPELIINKKTKLDISIKFRNKNTRGTSTL